MSEQQNGTETPFGSHVADFFGNLTRIKTNEAYLDSTNPNGDPFARMASAKEMVGLFASMHPNGLEVLNSRLDDFYEIKKNPEKDNIPKVYIEAKATIHEILSKKNE